MPAAPPFDRVPIARRQPSLLALARDDIACVAARDPAAGGRWEIALTYPGVHAIIWHRIANRLWRARLRFPARFLAWVARLLTNVDIHPAARIGARFFIDHGAGVVIGETAEIGNDVTLYHGVTLGGTSWSPGKRHPTLEDGVLVGCGAKILGPITIGKGARVGANSVVVDPVPPGMTVIGIPGRLVRPQGERRRLSGRIDLDHHLMPDPVGDAISELLDRIDFLEARLAHREAGRRERPVRETEDRHEPA
ncbi:serine O-acetyltransferase [Novosphingobium album (ex Liu et al. 2023)]|uniref:Serine acetyltransferase n=1 Tax=Novosphingobium album (ex Liu et al. 2023) TaxID=3031130 RepID=A0ABT5WSR0_9SPHN|nr:serine O-acetyltransferase [Novosphingobium album (ex Liu et al. 2023)]MDE8652889.1 serine O-acetyltransferase [Novosphingobium album (ex Liu et al. 2023)]